jgi:Rad3-related DNA helicase
MFSGVVVFKEILKHNVRSIILTSGTLSPMMQYEHELGISFNHKLQCDHVIPEENLFLEIISET